MSMENEKVIADIINDINDKLVDVTISLSAYDAKKNELNIRPDYEYPIAIRKFKC